MLWDLIQHKAILKSFTYNYNVQSFSTFASLCDQTPSFVDWVWAPDNCKDNMPCCFVRANVVVCELVDGVPTHGVFYSSTLVSLLPQGVVVTMVKMLTEKGRDHCLILTIWSHFVTILGKVSSVLCNVTPCWYNSSVVPNFKLLEWDWIGLNEATHAQFNWLYLDKVPFHLRCKEKRLWALNTAVSKVKSG